MLLLACFLCGGKVIMTGDALLAEILANPDDDTPRLIFADWLEEHGDSDRATFIRLQVQEPHTEPGSPEHRTITDQTTVLRRRHRDAWLADLPRGLTGKVTFKRGFVTEIQWISPAAAARIPKRVWARHPIQELVLHEVSGQLDRLLALPHLSRIRKLSLHAGRAADGLDASDLYALAACPNLTGLRSLAIHSGVGNSLAVALARCPSLPGMTSLYLDDENLDVVGVEILTEAGAANLHKLEHLSLHSRRISDGAARALADTPALAALQGLDMGEVNEGTIGDAGLAALAQSRHLAGLRRLWLYMERIGPEGARALAETPYLTGLQVLSLRRNPLGPAGARALAAGPWTKLTRLELDWCGLGDNGIVALAGARCLAGLTHLQVAENGIGPTGAAALARSSTLGELVFLDLRRNPIDDEGALALCRSRTLEKLQELQLTGKTTFSPAVVEALTQRFGKGLCLYTS
jgi:uncharacterized protein (TIGR02996 family)